MAYRIANNNNNTQELTKHKKMGKQNANGAHSPYHYQWRQRVAKLSGFVMSLSSWGARSTLMNKGDLKSDFPNLARVYEGRNGDS